MRGKRLIAAAAAAGGILGFAIPVATGADSASSLRARAGVLAQRSDAALLELYALESRVARARDQATTLRSRLNEVQREQVSARRRLGIARSTAAAAQRELGRQLRILYQEGEPSAIEIILGARSLDEAVAGIEGLRLSATQTNRVVFQARKARRILASLGKSLSTRASQLAALEDAAVENAAALEGARAEQEGYLARLAAERRLTARELASVQSQASAARVRSDRVAPAPAVAAASTPVLQPQPVASGGRTLTVESTGYALPGTTASGLPVGWGIVAVDPSVIPMGTRMTIPGYGEGVAADTGSAVQGLIIDLWFPTTAQALEWGRRTVTITIH